MTQEKQPAGTQPSVKPLLTKAQQRDARRAAAMRENLRRRKTQAAERTVTPEKEQY